MIAHPCLRCGTETRNAVFCSRGCILPANYLVDKATNCRICGVKFIVPAGTTYQHYCSDACRKIRDAVRRAKNVDIGTDPEDVRDLLQAQDGKCAICGASGGEENSGRGLSVDHDHVTGRIRGLLCLRCNTGIGFLRDDPVIVQRAAEYLTR